MSGRASGNLTKSFYILYSLGFLWLLNHIVTGSYYGYREIPLLLCVICALALMTLLWRGIGRHEAALTKRRRAITAGFLIFMFVLQMTFGALLRYRPVFDVDAVYGGAVEWVETGTFASYYEYYGYFFNNFGGLRFLYLVFKTARALGCTDYYMAAVTANALLSQGTMLMTGAVSERLLGPRGRFMAFSLFLISPPFYFLAPAFYTDALAMPFPILICWLRLLAKERTGRGERTALLLLMGLAAAVGILIKPVSAIAVIAVVIDAALTGDRRQAALISVTALLCLAVCCAGLYNTMYRHLDRDEAEKNRTPLLHWVMMGLRGNGMYNPEDYEYTRSFDDREKQTGALLEEIEARIRDRGFNGMVELLTAKGDICFGDGTYGLSDCLGGTPVRQTRLRALLLSDGAYYNVYKHLCAGVLLALYVLSIVSGVQEAFCPDSRTFRFPAPRLAVFGLLLFLICWEARWRYFSSFIPLIFVSALPGTERFSLVVRAAWRRLTGRAEEV